MRALVLARWPAMVAGAATLAYAVCVFGFGLVYRPLHNDEGVTLSVASNPSLRAVIDVAVNVRHGPPLHYVLVHFSLLWRDDVLGLRLPSALLGVAAVALAFGFGRELLGPAGGAIVSVIVAVSPAVVHLGQFSRGYTAMLAACFLSMWLLLLLLRTGRARWIAPYAVAAVLLASAHPFGIFALLSELAVLIVLTASPLRRGGNRRFVLVLAAAAVCAVGALLALRHVYAPLQTKYGVGHGSPVVHPLSWSFWHELGGAWSGSSYAVVWIGLGAVALAGIAVLAVRDHRAAVVCAVWLALPLALLSVLRATSTDFAPERHLSFMIPGYAAAVAGAILELGRRTGPWIAAGALALLMLPGAVAIVRDVGNFTPDLRDASLALAQGFGPDDVLLTSTGGAEPGVAARLYGAYAVLEAPSSSPLSRFRHVGDAKGCVLDARLAQRPAPDNAWVLMRPPDPDALVAQLAAIGEPQRFGEFVIARLPLRRRTVSGALRAGARAYHAADVVSGPVTDFGIVASNYRIALALLRAGRC